MQTGKQNKDLVDNALAMQQLIKALSKEGKRAELLIESKAQAMMNYDRAIGIAAAKHKASGMPATLIGHQAKSDAHEHLYKKIVAEESLKAHYSRMDTLKAQLNGYQSLNRYLDVS